MFVYTSMFSAIFTKGHKFCGFSLVSLDKFLWLPIGFPWQRDLSRKESIRKGKNSFAADEQILSF